MKRMGWLAALLIVISLMLPEMNQSVAADGLTPLDTATPMDSLSPEERALWTDLSAARASAGLAPLTLVSNEISLARARSADMAARAYFDHRNPDGKTMIDMLPSYGITYQAAGETIEYNLGIPDCGDEAARGFIASPPHHAILFNPIFTSAGVGHAVDASGKHYFTIIVIG